MTSTCGSTHAAVASRSRPAREAATSSSISALNLGGKPNSLGFTEGGSIRMTGSTSYVTAVSQDGFGAGVLEALRVDPDGMIYGLYTNGRERALGQIAVATFESEAGLERVGSNLFQDDNLSGEASLGVAGTGGRGNDALVQSGDSDLLDASALAKHDQVQVTARPDDGLTLGAPVLPAHLQYRRQPRSLRIPHLLQPRLLRARVLQCGA
jgi:hypothetical protein